MKPSRGIVGSTFLLAVCVLGMAALAGQEPRTGKRMYDCCSFPVSIAGQTLIFQGVWHDGDCICPIANPDLNPRDCPLFCEFLP